MVRFSDSTVQRLHGSATARYSDSTLQRQHATATVRTVRYSVRYSDKLAQGSQSTGNYRVGNKLGVLRLGVFCIVL